MGVLDIFRGKPVVEERDTNLSLSFNDWTNVLSQFSFGAVNYTLVGEKQENIASNFLSVTRGGYKANGVVFACIANRVDLFSEARFMFRRIRNGRPGDLFGNQDLQLLNTPWRMRNSKTCIAKPWLTLHVQERIIAGQNPT